MKKRLLFSLQYALLCTFTTFLMVTVFAKHYRFDAGFYAPVAASLLGAFLSGWLMKKRAIKKFRHLKTGVLALALTFVFSWVGFSISHMMSPHTALGITVLQALVDAWQTFLAGALIMVPAFILLVYLAEGAKKKETGME